MKNSRKSRKYGRRFADHVAGVAAVAALALPTMSLDEFIAGAATTPTQMDSFSCWQSKYPGPDGVDVTTPWRHNLTTTTASGYTNAYDWLAKAMGMGQSAMFATASAAAVSTTTISGTSLTNSVASFPTSGQGLAGQVVVVYGLANNAFVWGYITGNTGTALTVDQWYSATSTTGGAGTTPTTSGGSSTTGIAYLILPGQMSAAWLAVSVSTFTPSTADTSLNSQGAELAASGFNRAVGTYAHTAAASTYTLVHLWTATGTVTINNEGVSGAATLVSNNGGVFPFESAEPTPPTLVSGDTLQNTITVTI